MRWIFTAVPCMLLGLAIGCVRSDPPRMASRSMAAAQPAEPSIEPPWKPSQREAGYMFRDEVTFRAYVQRSEIVAIGILNSPDQGRWSLRVERVLRGQPAPELTLFPSGGGVRQKPGQRVIALLATDRGRLKLNSFCAAGGVYSYMEPLADSIRAALRELDRPLERPEI